MAQQINPCKCGSKKKPDFDSDDMIPCWAVQCYDCRQFAHGSNWTMEGALKAWNNANPITIKNK